MPAPGVVVVDKPAGMTSHDVVGRCRRIFGTRKVGHAGTLDPMATGVLVIGIERATKILGLISGTSKSYTATIRLGRSTTTDDAEGEAVQDIPAGSVTDAAIGAGVAALRGDILQRPSSVSAVKIGGKRAYRLARGGETVHLPSRPVRVDRFEVLGIRRGRDVVDVDVEVDCSSGTYIRALARDLGEALGVGGHLTALRRTRVGVFGLDQARTLEQLEADPRSSHTLDAACLLAFPRREITAGQALDCSHGRPLVAAGIDGVYAAVDPDGRVMVVLEDAGERTASVVVIRPATMRAPESVEPASATMEAMSTKPSTPAAAVAIDSLIGADVVRVPAGATIADVAKAIADHNVGVVVVGDDNRPAALVSERDVVRVVASGRNPAEVAARDIASTSLVWCEADDTVEEAAIRMTDREIRHPLVERDGVLAGIVSSRDLLGVYATETDPAL